MNDETYTMETLPEDSTGTSITIHEWEPGSKSVTAARNGEDIFFVDISGGSDEFKVADASGMTFSVPVDVFTHALLAQEKADDEVEAIEDNISIGSSLFCFGGNHMTVRGFEPCEDKTHWKG